MTEPVIVAANVSRSFGSGPAWVQALKDVNLKLNGGELTVLMGPSGSGKTDAAVDSWLHACAYWRAVRFAAL